MWIRRAVTSELLRAKAGGRAPSKGALTKALGSPNLSAVYVCHCRAVNDRAVQAAVENGARSIEELGRTCGAGTDCGSCHSTLARLLGCHVGDSGPELVGATATN